MQGIPHDCAAACDRLNVVEMPVKMGFSDRNGVIAGGVT
ncbi:hypothetical protein BRPE64_ECDS02310 (plasmid) [Caballeronia insecticola]|uniref:Uncharacterized protein n=1 Tax=Caballeronia insecticola TaxID=758793 RepID=A0A060PJK4_9BURK|nr:hypothetical protein BRPE64_ECDS02310 [Caballeronia insecticola]